MTVDEYKKLKSRSKYSNQKTERDGILFDSKAEANRYGELVLLQAHGAIENLKLQPKFRIELNGVKICVYIGDFEYTEGGKTVVEDVKGVKTHAYGLKKRLMKAVYGIEIREIK